MPHMKLSTKLLIGFTVLLVVCTLFSNSLVGLTRPKVAVKMAVPTTIDGQVYAAVVPTSAMITPNCVYTLERRDGFSGEELYLRATPVTIEAAFGEQTAVQGLAFEAYVVIGWDRPLEDGQRVMLVME